MQYCAFPSGKHPDKVLGGRGRKDTLTRAIVWMNPDNSLLSEKSQPEKARNGKILLM